MTAELFPDAAAFKPSFRTVIEKTIFILFIYGLDNRHIMICHSQTFRIHVRGNAAGHWVIPTGLKVKEEKERAAAGITLTRAGFFIGNIW